MAAEKRFHVTEPSFPAEALTTYEAKRTALLERIVEFLKADTRVVAAWLSGSFGRGDAAIDAWSDLDLHIAVEDESLSAFLANRDTLYRRIGDPLLIQPDMTSNAPPGGVFQLVIFSGLIEVDWIVEPASQATRPRETVILFARKTIPIDIPAPMPLAAQRDLASDSLIFFWAMAPIAVKYAARGDSRRASSQIDLLTGAFIRLWRLAELPDGPNPHVVGQNRATEPELDAILPRLEWDIDPTHALDVIRALCVEVERLHPALEKMGVSIPVEMPGETATMADLAESVIAKGPSGQRRTYR